MSEILFGRDAEDGATKQLWRYYVEEKKTVVMYHEAKMGDGANKWRMGATQRTYIINANQVGFPKQDVKRHLANYCVDYYLLLYKCTTVMEYLLFMHYLISIM
ncbi:unnamed protein product [Cuscuta epithymum]|uniref:Uncharacterized protein n=1 Tax=Cuscuta epithymum TaxID=186058 RepID=A0AAV0EQR9_9ASTE|nr:unnamed protein product [Cuscuta epithymum]